MAWGWSPGQAPLRSSVMKMTPGLFMSTQEMYRKPMREIVGDEINHYFISEEQFTNAKTLPWNVSPLAFMEYDEHNIIDKIKDLGWINPEGLDSNSTNCLLNAFANYVHIEKHKFHPYAFEIAGMVRTGVMLRDDGFEKIYGKKNNDSACNYAKEKLGIHDKFSGE
jgi:hypothetical protein